MALAVALSASSLQAQTIKDQVSPEIGVPVTSSVGDTVYEKSHQTVIPAFSISESFSGMNVFAKVSIYPGEKFGAVTSKSRLKACHAPSVEAFLSAHYDACLYDDDGDGTFDRYGANEVQGGKKLPHPFPYTPDEMVSTTSDAVKQTVIFLGSTKDSLRLSYREFINDMARPAFTEEYTFPLNNTFPQTVSFKGVKLQVNGIDGEGMHYLLMSVPS